MDFFKYRFGPAAHLLQSAKHAVNAGLPDNMVLACLLHDISTISHRPAIHGYWGAQLVEPYVDMKKLPGPSAPTRCCASTLTSRWATNIHQSYIKTFGAITGRIHISMSYKRMRNHKWYMSGRMITVRNIYSFDPDAKVELEEFTDVIGRNFRQPERGLGFDDSRWRICGER